MKTLLCLFALTIASSAQAKNFTCKQIGGDKDDVRLGRTLSLDISGDEATVHGMIWGKDTRETGRRDEADSRGQAVYVGFSSIQDDNADLRAYADKSLLKGKPGKFSFWLLGDGEDSVTGRYDYNCK
ncbi:MAG: hypothetical protein ACXVB9_10440 [Bdellovibrionota bacterium]